MKNIVRLGKISLLNADCMDYMRELPDNAFDLAIVDPPYGGARNDPGSIEDTTSKIRAIRTGGAWASKFGTKINGWDVAPKKEYFDELKRVSKNQIIWGANYFQMPPTRCFIVWRKITIGEDFTMAMAEYAWTSFNDNAKVFECPPQTKKSDQRIHPTQKPVKLYKWLLARFAKEGDRILDTHLGSGSICLAAHDLGFEMLGIEIDTDYFNAAQKRLIAHQQQTIINF